MPKNITLMGASFSDVPAVDLPQTGGGTARFIDPSPTTAIDSDVASGKIYYKSDGTQSVGTASAGQAISIVDELDSHGGTIRHINGIVVSGTKSITANGTGIDVTEYASVDVNVPTGGTPRTSSDLTVSGATVTAPAGTYATAASKSVASGSATAPATISGTSATVSTGTNTLTLTKTVSVTPSVTAGYVSSGTAGNSSVSLTASVTTQTAQTIYPSSTDQTISSGRYLTGTQTIKAVTTSNLTADNIKSGVTVTVGDSSDAGRVLSVTGTYSGGGTAMNTQTAQSTSRRNNTSLGSIVSLTCSTAGTYDVYWTCSRSNTSQTWGSRLYIGGTAYGTENTTWSNNVQTNHLTGVTIAKNATVAVYGRSRSGYYIYAPQLTIVQTA